MNLYEGGNVFKDAQGRPLTQRIKQADIRQHSGLAGNHHRS
jgi:hypothetical protein